MWILYQLALSATLLLGAPWWLLRRRPSRRLIAQRFGSYPEVPDGHDLWIHAVSVGEVAVASDLVRALPRSISLVVTTVTPTGQERATATMGDRATVVYFPLDLSPSIRSFLERLRPRALVLVESELWPLLLETTRRRDIPTALVNARISDRSFRRLQRFRRPAKALLLGKIDAIGAQSSQDLARLEALGVETDVMTLTGNLKYDAEEPPRLPALESAVRTLADGRTIFVAGSTMPGEEQHILDALRSLPSGSALLVLAPRHPERCDAVVRQIEQLSIPLLRRSTLDLKATDEGTSPQEIPNGIDVLVLDTLGELASIYRLADASFIGGTLVDTGGHNPLEAARFAKPVFVGPSMHNFKEMADHFDESNAWIRVESSQDLATSWQRIVEDHQAFSDTARRARELVDSHRGALDRTLVMLERMGALPER